MLAQRCTYAVGGEEVAGFLPRVGVSSRTLDDDVVIRPLGVEDVVRFGLVGALDPALFMRTKKYSPALLDRYSSAPSPGQA